MGIVYSVEIGDPIENAIKGNPKIYFNSISDALTDALYTVEKLEEIHGKEFVFSEKEPITKGNKANSLQIWRGYVEGVNEPLYIQLNIVKNEAGKELTTPKIPQTNLNEDQMVFISELEYLLNIADQDNGLFYH